MLLRLREDVGDVVPVRHVVFAGQLVGDRRGTARRRDYLHVQARGGEQPALPRDVQANRVDRRDSSDGQVWFLHRSKRRGPATLRTSSGE